MMLREDCEEAFLLIRRFRLDGKETIISEKPRIVAKTPYCLPYYVVISSTMPKENTRHDKSGDSLVSVFGIY
jgi:hypothetical protein